MLGFDFDIVYKPRCENKAADALSRKPMEEGELKAIMFVVPTGADGIQEEVMKDEKLRGIIQELLRGTITHAGYELRKGNLMYKRCMVVPKNSRLVQLFLLEFHSSPIGGHFGFFLTYKKISSILY
ncbi:uncharacterized protein LOC123215247 [Mangifera indica]|uniref:uncharacterized protein LOC123215247 n=1 Tax=Mangifera indica TaxID=29780 RepID=UPI001CF9F05B|nr:uncharacterized protein LOC123215247 [Mangifera indica]